MTIKVIAIGFLLALMVVGVLLLLQMGNTSINHSDWAPLNNGYPGWSNKVQPF